MRRVYLIWFTKKAAPYFLAELALFSGFLYLVGHYVFVSQVLQYASQILANSSINPVVWGSFTIHLFLKTRFIVQLSVLGSLAMIFLLLKNFTSSWAQLVLVKQETKSANQSFHN